MEVKFYTGGGKLFITDSFDVDSHGDFTVDENGFLNSVIVSILYDGELLIKYYNHGYLHRLDGPAIIRKSYEKTIAKTYYINGKYYVKKDFDIMINRNNILNEL